MIPRWMHRLYAFVFGYFWLPCPSCGRMFGGHEKHGGTLFLEQTETGARGKVLCPRCPHDLYAEGVEQMWFFL